LGGPARDHHDGLGLRSHRCDALLFRRWQRAGDRAQPARLTLERRGGLLHTARIVAARHRANLGDTMPGHFEQDGGTVRRVGREIDAQRIELERNPVERARRRRSCAESAGAKRERDHEQRRGRRGRAGSR